MRYSSILKTIVPVIVSLLIFAAPVIGQDRTVTINIDQAKTYQTINNFGASDAWSCQFVGKWPEEKKNKIADLLFSKDTLNDGSPKGIALSLWRFNIGAGSAEQGDESHIKDEWHRTELFSAGSEASQKQVGQLWFLKAAKERGVNEFLGFVNSPPVTLTINSKGYATDGQTNIAPGNYGAFAGYLANVIKGVEQVSGIKLNYISPVNEPQWKWSDAGQEGCPYKNTEIAGLIRSVNNVFSREHIRSTILVGEAGSINYLFSAVDNSAKGNQVDDFFKPNSPDYIGDLHSITKSIAAHSYFTTSPMSSAIQARKLLSDKVSTVAGLTFWQSEYCILGDNAGEINGSKRDLGIDAALYMARVIHTDLTSANAAAWQWWLAISPYDYKDGLIYVDKNKTDGNYYASKMLWAMGNYSRFVRPGAVRVDVNSSSADPLKTPLLISAFKNGKTLTVVIVNNNETNVPVKINMGHNKIKHARTFTTSSSSDLKAGDFINMNSPISIQARSITSISGIIQ